MKFPARLKNFLRHHVVLMTLLVCLLFVALWHRIDLRHLFGLLFLGTFDSPKINGLNTIVWGTDGIMDTGTIITARNMRTGKKEEVPDNFGWTQAVIYFDDQNQCEVEVLLQSDSTAPERGDFVTLFALSNCQVDDVEKMYDQKNVGKYRIKATAYDAIAAA
jgi:hypothetical protein